jgi:hypothetical protein
VRIAPTKFPLNKPQTLPFLGVIGVCALSSATYIAPLSKDCPPEYDIRVFCVETPCLSKVRKKTDGMAMAMANYPSQLQPNRQP